jgi:hypothetical protein
MTRDEFLEACRQVTHFDEVVALMHAVGPQDPGWLSQDDAQVAWHCLQIQLRVYRMQQVLRAEVDAKQAQVDQLLDEVRQLLDEARQEKADAQVMRDAAQVATDDLDLFQAGYERGYAQGWAHRGVQPKEEPD